MVDLVSVCARFLDVKVTMNKLSYIVLVEYPNFLFYTFLIRLEIAELAIASSS